jgi:two-component system, chemotaxis family, sensor kinase CheA
MSEMEEIIKEFLVECNDNLDQMDEDLVELEKDPTSQELLARVFRAIHTVKGTSGVLGFPKLESVAHVGENLLSKLRDGKLRLNTDITSGLLQMVDAIREILQAIESGGQEGARDYGPVAESLNRLLESELRKTSQAAPDPPLMGQIFVEKLKVPQDAIDAALSQQAAGDLRKLGEILVERGDVTPHAVLDALKTQVEAGLQVSASNIRVDVNLLDKLMNLVGELVLARNQILQYTASQKDSAFLGTAQRLNLITTELQEGVMKTRMQPIGNVWNKFPRVVRDLSLQFGKQVRVEMEGSETELDKTIIEAIKDPLTHVLRNSIDHGIELPEQRVAAGKQPEGRVSLRAFHEGGQVNIEVSDDGAGINLERIKQKAVERGQITAEQAARMSEREAQNLIFLAGLSTAQKVTNVSGRGVGMDVVKTNIEKIGGTVDVHSVAGEGTTLKIKIPLTLAIIPALIATSGGERFAIPQVNLLELVRLEGEQAQAAVENLHGAPVYRLRGHLLPLVYLQRQLQLGSEDTGRDGINIVVLQADDRQFGLVVEEINDTEEIVVKPLGKYLKGSSCFAGATIMGDGQVALILDVLGIAQMANVVTEVRERAVGEGSTRKTDSAVSRDAWLVFRVGGMRRMAIPLSVVSRLEEIAATSVERSGQSLVVQYRGQIMPLIDVAAHLNLGSCESNTETLQVIVYRDNGHSVGLLVDQILDIVEQTAVIDQKESASGLLGSAVIQDRVTDLLDVRTMANPFAGSGWEAR